MKQIEFDNAARIYTAASTKDWSAQYHMGITLHQAIDVALLRRAVCALAPRFPTLYSQVYAGQKWDYLVPATNFDVVMPDSDYPCRVFPIGTGARPLFRILVKERTIGLEMFHSLTDGTGAMVFLKTLLAQYLTLSGHAIPATEGVLDITEAPLPEELVDEYQAFYDKARRSGRKEPLAYQYRAQRSQHYFGVTKLKLSVTELKKVVKANYGCTINDFLVATLGYIYYEQYKKDVSNPTKNRPIRISTPINLRTVFPCTTLRNFAMFNNVDIEPQKREYDFVSILQELQPKLKAGFDKERLTDLISQNVHEEKQWIARVAPNKYKKPVMRFFFRLYGERMFTSQVSNMGLQKLPETMLPFVQDMELFLGETLINSLSCAVISVGDIMTICFSSTSKDATIQKAFYKFLVEHTINVQLEPPK